MPINKDAYARYRIIDDVLNYRKYVSLQRLKEYCEERLDDTFSDRTIKNDIYTMRDTFDAPIEFDKLNKGYFYAENFSMQTTAPLKSNDVSALHFAASMLGQFQEIPVLADFKSTADKIIKAIKIRQEEENNNFIQFEKTPFFKGGDFLSDFATATRRNYPVKFTYQRFSTDSEKEHILHPYLLKEYRNRWYVIGWHPEREMIRIFGLDRIQKMEVLEDIFDPRPDFEADTYFKHSLGITVLQDQEPQEIILLFNETQGKYIQAQPMHETQEVEESSEGLIVRLKLLITYELVSEILNHGEKVKVLAPQSLQDLIKERLMQALKQYE